jgi:hypothetical protein
LKRREQYHEVWCKAIRVIFVDVSEWHDDWRRAWWGFDAIIVAVEEGEVHDSEEKSFPLGGRNNADVGINGGENGLGEEMYPPWEGQAWKEVGEGVFERSEEFLVNDRRNGEKANRQRG